MNTRSDIPRRIDKHVYATKVIGYSSHNVIDVVNICDISLEIDIFTTFQAQSVSCFA